MASLTESDQKNKININIQNNFETITEDDSNDSSESSFDNDGSFSSLLNNGNNDNNIQRVQNYQNDRNDQNNQNNQHFFNKSYLLKNSYFLTPQSHKSEYQIRPYIHFDNTHIESLQNDNKKKQEKFKSKRDRALSLMGAIDFVDANNKFPKNDFIDGIYRHEPNLGTEYILNYKKDRQVKLFRPFAEYQVIDESADDDPPNPKINFIIPFSCMSSNCGPHQKHLSRLSEFLTNIKFLLQYDDNFSLHIIWMESDMPDYDAIIYMNKLIRDLNENKYHGVVGKFSKFFDANRKFSRGAALHYGVEMLRKESGAESKSNNLMFFVDIDVHINHNFFKACRAYTKPNKSVFYPIVFSLYNPILVQKQISQDHGISQGVDPVDRDHLELDPQKLRKIHKDYGFWRDFGYGMSCQYESDYIKVGGFDLSLKGWGMEDVKLYREYAKSDDYFVIRTPFSGLVHDWHEKNCDSGSSEYYRVVLDWCTSGHLGI